MPLARIAVLITFFLSLGGSWGDARDDYFEIPVRVQAAFMMKLLSLNQNLKGEVTVAVMGADELAAKLDGLVGRPIGPNSTLGEVLRWTKLGESHADVLLIGEDVDLEAALTFTRSSKILSATGSAELVFEGVSLGIVGFEGKPKVLLNRVASDSEGVKWNRAIFDLCDTVGDE